MWLKIPLSAILWFSLCVAFFLFPSCGSFASFWKKTIRIIRSVLMRILYVPTFYFRPKPYLISLYNVYSVHTFNNLYPWNIFSQKCQSILIWQKIKIKATYFEQKKAFSFKDCTMKVYHQILSEEMFPFSKTYLMKNSVLKMGSKRTNP